MIMDWMRDFAGSRDSLRRRTLTGGNWLMGKSLICGALELMRAAIFFFHGLRVDVISGLISHFLATIMAFTQLKSPSPTGNHENCE